MRILYIHQHFNTPKGSVGTRSYEFSKALIQNGHSVTVICGSYGTGSTGLTMEFEKGVRRGLVDGIDVIELNLAYSNEDSFIKRGFTFFRFAGRATLFALREDYDVVVATSTPLTAGIPGIFSRWLRHKTFVFEVRDLWPELPREMGVITNPIVLSALSLLEWASYHSANRCIGLAPGIIDGIHGRGIDRSKIRLISNGCDLDVFGGNVTDWRPEGVLSTDLMAVYAGTHGVANGLGSVLDAAGVLMRRGRSDIKIVFVGEGKQKKALQERASREGLDNVIFHPAVDKFRLAGLMASADIGLQILDNVPAFYFGTSPNKFFDYISAGLPVLNNYPGWVAELIEKHQCGFSVEPENSNAFADALESAASNGDDLKLMGMRAKSCAEDYFDRNMLSQKWIDWVVGAG